MIQRTAGTARSRGAIPHAGISWRWNDHVEGSRIEKKLVRPTAGKQSPSAPDIAVEYHLGAQRSRLRVATASVKRAARGLANARRRHAG
jgi:hypothetical protein